MPRKVCKQKSKLGKVYIHYGETAFDKDMFCKVKNSSDPSVKPTCESGLWASPVDAEFGWKDFCISENFRTDELNKSFRFRLTPGARVAHIYNLQDLYRMPNRFPDYKWRYCIDFEKLAKRYDAIELHLINNRQDRYSREYLRYLLYGWDCDSILIFNHDIIKGV